MLKLSRDSTVIDFDKFFEDLNYLGFIYVNPKIMKKYIEEMDILITSLSNELHDLVVSESYFGVMDTKAKSLILFLKEYLHVPAYYFEVKGKDGIIDSLDAKKVLKPLKEAAELHQFSEDFVNWRAAYELADTLILLRSVKSKRGLVTKMLGKAFASDKVDINGDPLVKVNFKISPRDNLRVYYSDTNIQQIPKTTLDSFVAPKGYVIVSGDFSQSDLRIAYSTLIRDKSNINEFMSYSDTYKAFTSVLMGDEFDAEHFDANRKDYKTEALKTLYGGTRASSAATKKLVSAANKFLASCPVYAENKRRIVERINKGLPLRVQSYFGYSQVIEKNPKYGKYWKHKMLDKALNAPIQTGTSEAVISVERYILDAFAAVGATPENGGIYSYICRHDELVFLLKEEFLEYSYIFQNAQRLQVDDWTPLEIEFHYCRNYGQDDEQVTQVAKANYSEKIAKENAMYMPTDTPSKYIPTANLLSIATNVIHLRIGDKNKALVSFVDYKNQRLSCKLYDYSNPDGLHDNMLMEVLSHAQVFLDEDVSDVILYSPLVAVPVTTCSNILVQETNQFSSKEIYLANVVANFAAASYLKENGEEYSQYLEQVNHNKDIVNIIKNWEDLFDN